MLKDQCNVTVSELHCMKGKKGGKKGPSVCVALKGVALKGHLEFSQALPLLRLHLALESEMQAKQWKRLAKLKVALERDTLERDTN